MFLFGGDTQISYEDLQRRRRMAHAMMRNDRTPKNVGEGLHSFGKSIAGALMARNANKREGELIGELDQQISDAKGPYHGIAAAMIGQSTYKPRTKEQQIGDDAMRALGKYDHVSTAPYANAIASIESAGSGDYSAVGPETGKGRAYGRYQVMDFNIPSWTKTHLGREMTPDEFLASPEAQDAVFHGQFGRYLDTYGTPQDAASVWFTGKPVAEAGNVSDGYTTAPEYVAKFNAALSGEPAPTPGGTSGDMSRLQPIITALSNPMIDRRPGEKALLNVMLQREMAAMYPDPMQQLELQRAQLELERLRNPKRDIVEGADGYKYYADTGERVLPGAEKPAFDFETEQKLRKEFSGLTTAKDFLKVNDAWDRIQVSAANPSSAGDLALIFNFMKLLDPESVVREGEFATAQNTGSVDERIWGLYNRILNGKRLTDTQRADFLDRSGQLFNAQAGNFNDAAEHYRELATQYNLSPDRIAQNVELYGQAAEKKTWKTFEEFAADKDMRAVAERYGVTLQELWEDELQQRQKAN